MNLHPATTKIIKTGKSKTPFLLFFGNRKHDKNELTKPLSGMLTGFLLTFIVIILSICIYAFFSGRLG
jgi:predicted permease